MDASDEKMQRVFKKLLEIAKVEYKKNIKVNLTIMMMSQQGGGLAANDFLASLVWKETPTAVTRLAAEQPGAMEDSAIWPK